MDPPPQPASPPGATIDRANTALFGAIAADWWDPDGRSRLLHRLNRPRLAFLRAAAIQHFGLDPSARQPLDGLSALDLGCGGGLVAEPLARLGARVVGLDASPEAIAVAKAHAEAQGLAIDYRSGELAHEPPALFDLITCFEVIEHVRDLDSFLGQLAARLSLGGLLVWSTPPRTLASLAVVKLGGEYLTGAIPRGAHDWRRFQTLDELTRAFGRAGLVPGEVRGLSYTPGRGFAVSAVRAIDLIGTARPIAKDVA